MCDGLFGDLFDLNGDGHLDSLEQGAEIGFLVNMLEEEDEEKEDDDDLF